MSIKIRLIMFDDCVLFLSFLSESYTISNTEKNKKLKYSGRYGIMSTQRLLRKVLC